MSRSNYSYDVDQWALIKYRGQVASAIRGKRGQKMFREMAEALDAMPEKRLITSELVCKDGVCALGALGQHRGLDMVNLEPDDSENVAAAFDIADQLANEVVFENDEHVYGETPEERWHRMRRWVGQQVIEGKRS